MQQVSHTFDKEQLASYPWFRTVVLDVAILITVVARHLYGAVVPTDFQVTLGFTRMKLYRYTR